MRSLEQYNNKGSLRYLKFKFQSPKTNHLVELHIHKAMEVRDTQLDSQHIHLHYIQAVVEILIQKSLIYNGEADDGGLGPSSIP